MRVLLFVLAFLASPAVAQDALCDDLWFTRNLVFDRAGYCFGSALGQSVFGNDGCTTKNPQLSAKDKDIIDRVRSYEAEWGCKVDTGRTRLAISDLSFRKALTDLPIMTGYESGCIRWKGAVVPLFAGKSPNAPKVGELRPGQSILTAYENADGWEFVTISDDNGTTLATGWAFLDPVDWTCEQYAG